MEKDDAVFRQRRTLVRKAASQENPPVPFYRDGPWAGAAVVVRERNYTFVLSANLKGELHLNPLSPTAPDQAITALSPTFQHRNPRAPEKERGAKPLDTVKVTSTKTFPLILEASPRGTEVEMEIEFENGRTGSLKYVFEANAIRVSARVADAKQPANVTSLVLSNRFPSTHTFAPEVTADEVKRQLAAWRVDRELINGEKETIGWWEPTKGAMVRRVNVVGPWAPWRFVFHADDKDGGRPMQFGIYPGFAPYREGFGISRWAAEDNGDLVLEWEIELVR